jgi:hypothetical protein
MNCLNQLRKVGEQNPNFEICVNDSPSLGYAQAGIASTIPYYSNYKKYLQKIENSLFGFYCFRLIVNKMISRHNPRYIRVSVLFIPLFINRNNYEN